jgi:hypothetical protein
MGSRNTPVAYADVEISFPADPRLRAVVRSVAVEAAQADHRCADDVRLATDSLVRTLLVFAPDHAQVRCLFRTREDEVRIRASLPDATITAPAAKAHSATLLDLLDLFDLPVSMRTIRNGADRTELVCETVLPRHSHHP